MNPDRPISSLVVCRYFLGCEFAKGRFDSNPASFSDDQIKQGMIELGQHQPNNPAVVWLGYSSANQRPSVSWCHVIDIDVRAVISKGLNPAWKRDLEGVDGNLSRFVAKCQSIYKTEYDRTRLPLDEHSLIIGIVHPERPSEIELIDGSHRLASMILNDRKTVQGYVGFTEGYR